MHRWLLLALATLPFTAGAIVIRSDVDDSAYRVPASAFPALADMPGEGHGVLIAPRWVVTAAHAAPMEGMDAEVEINGQAYRVERVVVHPGYRRMPDELGQAALASGNPGPIHAFLAASDDIALIQLATPVSDVPPVRLYRGQDEAGRVATLVGKGATGTGSTGLAPGASHRGMLRRGENAVTGGNERYLWYRFDGPQGGLPLEGVIGNGDSGGPLLLQDQTGWHVIGLASWITAVPEHALDAGFYGQVVQNVRISRYAEWIVSTIRAAP
ncbi:trypsin-like serine protease [Stenotrophomonas sp. S39]|uniref:S1 family peptidase n=1 Tax=Stenotrophomonas sp. S39 TaxID=2767451 RepID=UPI001909F493|nr:trypsin-like serine protease [Stenotrophomonas sp. S39]MBK0053255.1 trypsin-like serine protease [Stenotrophomonas sp. S39]